MSRNLKIAEAFKKARQMIKSDQERFICNGLDNISYRPSRRDCDAAKAIINNRMGRDIHTLGCWVCENVYQNEYYPNRDEMKEYRLRWLGALIKEFS